MKDDKGKKNYYRNPRQNNKKRRYESDMSKNEETQDLDRNPEITGKQSNYSGKGRGTKSRNPKSYDKYHSNDISWWNQSPLFEDATRLPFNRIMGDPINLGWNLKESDAIGITVGNDSAIPGIMTINYIPTIGVATSSNDPVNRAFTSLYGDIYSKTTGAMQFQQADLALFVLSFSSIAAMIACAKRALAVSTLYTGMNYYYPKALITAMGFNPDSIIGYQDALRSQLNDCILSFNALKIPDFMSIYKRQYALCSNIYADEDDVVSQLYVFQPTGYYQYVETVVNPVTQEETPAYLSYQVCGASSLTAFIKLIDDAIEVWRQSSDLGIIAGSIQRAFSDQQLIRIDYATPSDVIVPQFDRNITWQINNMTINGYTTDLDITQDVAKNLIRARPKTNAALGADNWLRYGCPDNYIINSFDNITDSEFVMEATRLLQPYPFAGGAPSYAYYSFVNTEIVHSVDIHVTEYNSTTNELLLESYSIDNTFFILDLDDPSLSTTTKFEALMHLSKFKNGPRLFVFKKYTLPDESKTIYAYTGICGDLYKYTTIDRNSLSGLNKVALQSVFNVQDYKTKI